MGLAMLAQPKPIVVGAVLAQNLEGAGMCDRRWRVEAIRDHAGVAHARLITEDSLNRKTLAVGALTGANGWSNA